MVLGVIAAYLLLLPKRKFHLGIALIALFTVLEVGFVGTAFVVAKPVLDELAWPIVLTGNFLAAAGMACYLSLRRRKLALRQRLNNSRSRSDFNQTAE